MNVVEEIEIFYPKNKAEWRNWLEINHKTKQSVWIVFYKKAYKKPTLTWSESVDEALCFGWIDSKKIAIDHEKSYQFFSKRKAKGTWSKINKHKILILEAQDLMTPAGNAIIELAKQNGSWTILDEVDNLEMPDDFKAALESKTNAISFYSGLSNSIKKMMLYWLKSAKRPETREKRISEIVELADKGQKPRQF